MKSVNLYELTRVSNENFNEFEAHLSQRENINSLNFHEIKSLKAFLEHVLIDIDYDLLNYFYFSYSIPQISKEFDLLRLGNYIINIELKSHINSVKKVTEQLIQNIFYLKHLEKEIFLYVYDSESNQLFQLQNNQLQEIEFSMLIEKIKNQTDLFNDDINMLFKPSMFLVSPLNNTEKFLQGEYFLTLNQLQIKECIDKIINNPNIMFMAINGKAGCGKTLLAYDIALDYANQNNKVCIIHCANLCEGQEILNNNSPLDIFPIKKCQNIDYSKYAIIIIDEAQRMRLKQFNYIIEQVKKNNIKLIFSYDEKQMINSDEVSSNIPSKIESFDGIKIHKLSKKIRTNPEILSFVKRLFNLTNGDKFKNYKNINLKYAATHEEVMHILHHYTNNEYEFINFTPSQYTSSNFDYYRCYTSKTTHNVIGQEFDNVIMYLDNNFYYKDNKLQARNHVYKTYLLKQMLFQGITRTRNKLLLVIVGNEDLFQNILSILKQ